jgi:hypothetical protein
VNNEMPVEAGGRRLAMFDSYIIEIRSAGIEVQAGVVVRDGRGFRFFAATRAFDRLDGQLFANPKAAERAALHHVAKVTAPRQLGRSAAAA